MLTRLLTIAFLSMSCSLTSTAAPVPNKEIEGRPTIGIVDVVTRRSVGPVGMEMLTLAHKGVKEVSLVINSPGGSVLAGNLFLAQMQAAQGMGMKVHCYVPQIAASMAFHILMYCDSRTVLDQSYLLWHGARVQLGGFMPVIMTATSALRLANDLIDINDVIYGKLIQVLNKDMTVESISEHFEAETLHSGQLLASRVPNAMKSKAYIPGLFEALARLSKASAGGDAGEEDTYSTIIYMHQRALDIFNATHTTAK